MGGAGFGALGLELSTYPSEPESESTMNPSDSLSDILDSGGRGEDGEGEWGSVGAAAKCLPRQMRGGIPKVIGFCVLR